MGRHIPLLMHSVNNLPGEIEMRMFCFLILTIIVEAVCLASNGYAVKQLATEKAVASNNCEINIARIDYINNHAGKTDLIIAIARLGQGERSSAINRRRLHNVRTYLIKFLGRNPETILVAEGEPVKGRSRIEFFVKGVLVDALGTGINEDLYVGSCEDSTENDKLLFDNRRRKNR